MEGSKDWYKNTVQGESRWMAEERNGPSWSSLRSILTFFFEAGSRYVAQEGLKLAGVMWCSRLTLPRGWDYRCVPLCPGPSTLKKLKPCFLHEAWLLPRITLVLKRQSRGICEDASTPFPLQSSLNVRDQMSLHIYKGCPKQHRTLEGRFPTSPRYAFVRMVLSVTTSSGKVSGRKVCLPGFP